MKLETPVVTLQKPREEIYHFLKDLNNFEQVMPSNKEKFEVDGDSFIIGLYGIPDIRMVYKEQEPSDNLVLRAASSKIDFSLAFNLTEVDENTTQTQLLFDGNFNPMVAMMVKNPLTNFINDMSENLKTI